MQLILDIEESQKDILLNIIKNLKEGIVKKYTLRPSVNRVQGANIESVSHEEEDEIKDILENMTVEDKQVAYSSKYSIDL